MAWLARHRFDRVRKAALANGNMPGWLRDYLENPIPHFDGEAARAPILAVDFETNGLDPVRDHLLSVGAVALTDGLIDIGSGWHTLVASRRDLDASVVPVHKITHDMVEAGLPVDEALAALFSRLQGRFLLAHHALVEVGFLREILMKLYGVRVPFATVDTWALEQLVQSRRHQADSLRLLEARKRYGLPPYMSHHALTDALAAAELFLAQCAHHFSDAPIQRLIAYHP